MIKALIARKARVIIKRFDLHLRSHHLHSRCFRTGHPNFCSSLLSHHLPVSFGLQPSFDGFLPRETSHTFQLALFYTKHCKRREAGICLNPLVATSFFIVDCNYRLNCSLDSKDEEFHQGLIQPALAEWCQTSSDTPQIAHRCGICNLPYR
jgi:hypothetical protein